ncbi:MAG: YfhO family protein, partial [Clostridiales bacterium]|nr:YfhO family protein [Clostridiales bacterium]
EAHTNRRLRRNNPRYKSDNGKKIAAVALLTLLLIDSGFNFYQMTGSIQFGRASQLAAYQKTLSAAIRSVEQQPRTAALYRIQNNLINPTLSYYNENADYNNSLLIPYYGINSYTSTLNSRLLETLQSLGLYSQNVRCINDTGLTAFSSYLLNVNYEITPYPPGFGEPVIKDNVDGNYILQKNETSSSIGYVLPGIEKVQIDQMEPFKNQDRIAQTVLKDPDLSLFTPVTTSAAGNDIWTATAGAAGGLYIYLPEYTQWEMTVTVNGQEESQISGGSADLVQVTRVAKGDKISLAFTGENIPGLPGGALQILNHDALDKAIGEMDAGRADLAYDQRQNIFKGTVNAPESGTLFLSIPYDSQWQVLVDGKQAPAKAVLGGAFIGVDLTGGHHSLEIYYMPKTLILSAVVSAAAVLCLIVLRRIHLRKIKQN